jgi:hypothetical protein
MNLEMAYEKAKANQLNIILGNQDLETGFSVACSRALERAYESGFHGAFGTGGDVPEWCRVIATYERDKLIAETEGSVQLEELLPTDVQGQGRGKRACHWNYYLETDPARALRGSQDYGNCTAWALREITGCELATDIKHRHESQQYTKRPGTAVTYGSRGHSGQGSALATLVRVIHQKGIQVEEVYCDGKYDLRNEVDDERYGNSWGRSGPPSCILNEIANDKIETWAYATDADACLDVLWAGHFMFHGSTLTANTNSGRLVSSLRSIGGHAQAWIGYDDTDEARDWVRQVDGTDLGNDWIAINDQSWGRWNTFPDSKWPTHLWGKRPEGVWCVRGSDQMKIVRQWKDCIAISNVKGFPRRDLDWSMF